MAGLPGNAACNWARPFGVGVSAPSEVETDPPSRVWSQYVLPKNHSLFLRIGPPNVPPNLLSTLRGTMTGVHPVVAGSSPEAQNPSSGLFCPFCRELPHEPV